jgi:tetratricopeptide (TPR) repeat protein
MATSHYAEGARRLEDALASNTEDGQLTARALTYLGTVDAARGRSGAALSRLEHAIALWDTVGDDTESTAARDELGWALYEGGQESRALELFHQNLELARRLDHHALVNRSLAGVCQLLVVTGQFERAERWHWSFMPKYAIAKTSCTCARRITTWPIAPCTGGTKRSPSSTD